MRTLAFVGGLILGAVLLFLIVGFSLVVLAWTQSMLYAAGVYSVLIVGLIVIAVIIDRRIGRV